MTEQVIETPTQRPARLTKAQKEFFGSFASNAVQNILGPVLEFKGIEITAEQLAEVVKTLDLTELTNDIGRAFIDRVDFKTIVKVDKFMKGEEFTNVVLASSEVSAMVQGELVQIIAPLIPQDEAPAEQSTDELADLAS